MHWKNEARISMKFYTFPYTQNFVKINPVCGLLNFYPMPIATRCMFVQTFTCH